MDFKLFEKLSGKLFIYTYINQTEVQVLRGKEDGWSGECSSRGWITSIGKRPTAIWPCEYSREPYFLPGDPQEKGGFEDKNLVPTLSSPSEPVLVADRYSLSSIYMG